MKKKIIITGGKGKLAKLFKPYQNLFNIKFPTKKELNILNIKKISRYLDKNKTQYLIHNAALSRPMDIHEKDIRDSISKNIIGTCNIINECSKRNGAPLCSTIDCKEKTDYRKEYIISNNGLYYNMKCNNCLGI